MKLLQQKMLFQQRWKKVPTRRIFLLHNLALPLMAWILGRWHRMWELRSNKKRKTRQQEKENQVCRIVFLALRAKLHQQNHEAMNWDRRASIKEPSLIPKLLKICYLLKDKELGRGSRLIPMLRTQGQPKYTARQSQETKNIFQWLWTLWRDEWNSCIWRTLTSPFLNFPVSSCFVTKQPQPASCCNSKGNKLQLVVLT